MLNLDAERYSIQIHVHLNSILLNNEQLTGGVCFNIDKNGNENEFYSELITKTASILVQSAIRQVLCQLNRVVRWCSG